MNSKIQSVRGMHDILPSDLPCWHFLESTLRDIMPRYGYDEIRTPVVEKSELFERAIGDSTDVVEKEMYSFEDRGGDHLSLRPEGTASVVRATLQNGLLYASPLRLWYCGPMFRRERPQRGRTRQFHQVGVEAFGAAGPDIDAEIIALGETLWRSLGLSDLRLEINTLGTLDERLAFRSELRAFLESRKKALDEDSLRRLDRNPLRILDSKNPKVQQALDGAPELSDHLGDESKAHFRELLGILDDLDIGYVINPRLVRGLDYYSHAVFEWISEDLGAQGTICAGGRYDGLVEMQGGKPWPAVGFAMGMERIIELLTQAREFESQPPHVYLVLAGEDASAPGLMLAERLRQELPGLQLVSNVGGGSFKSQFKRADRSGAAVALVLGEDEIAAGTVTVKFLREDVPQETVALESIGALLQKVIQP